MRYSDIAQRTRITNYCVNADWCDLEDHLKRWMKRDNELAELDIDPDFQRDHVWTEAQQRAYVEHILKGGGTSTGVNTLRFNCVGWGDSYKGPFVLVDGKQRLEAVRKFLRNELRVLKNPTSLDVVKGYKGKLSKKGYLFSEIEGRLPSDCNFLMLVNNLPSRAHVLKWYLELNEGGTVHTESELEKVRQEYNQIK